MELPPVFLFETYADPTAKQVAYELLPKLEKVEFIKCYVLKCLKILMLKK